MTQLPLDETARMLRYYSVNLGEQAIIRMEGSDGILVVANPDDGRRPYFYWYGVFTDIARAGEWALDSQGEKGV